MRVWFGFALCAGCSFQHGVASSGDGVDASISDVPTIDDAALPVFPSGPFGTPTLVPLSLSSVRDDDVTLTGDMLEMFFESDRETIGQSDIYSSKRASVNDPWPTPIKVAELSTSYLETSMEVSTDGRTIYFSSNRPPSSNIDVFVATRPDRNSPWSEPTLVTALSSTSNDYNAQPWSDTVLYMTSDRQPVKGGSDVFRATRGSAGAAWSAPTIIAGLDTSAYEGEAFADATGAIWFTGNAAGDDDLWRAEPNGDGTFKTPQLIEELGTPASENDPWLSPDGHTLYFTSNRNGSLDIFVAHR